MKLLYFAGSLRKDSLNKKLLSVAKSLTEEAKLAETTQVDIKILNIPIYDGDIEKEAFPETVRKLGEMVTAADGLVIASPEYNGSISSPLKNTIDWLSRLKPVPLEKKPVLLMGASPSNFGASRGIVHSRAPLDKLSAYVFPENMFLPKAHEAFTDSGDLKDEKTKKRLVDLLKKYAEFVQKLKT